MSNTWFISDTHFGHANILKFVDANGTALRPVFANVQAMDDEIVARWNERVRPKDRVYHMGDVAMGRQHIQTVARCHGRKVLLRGNHDIFKLKDYSLWFDDVRSYKVYPVHGIIVSHVPIHPSQLEHRFKWNVHGHTHANSVLLHPDRWINGEPHADPRYINLCVEQTAFAPVSFEEVLAMIERRTT